MDRRQMKEHRVEDLGWVGTGKPMQIGSGYTRRDICDGQSLGVARSLGSGTQDLP